jgi:rhamnopyranosyl-N-acetylglucosaminyl-diphospho-decaprenol beta-1,3/1,4-galactofuranosyltransferase
VGRRGRPNAALRCKYGGGVSPSVASVTVAYNAVKVLPLQMDALLRQGRQLQEIIVVDNASSDGTGALVAERYPHVTLLRMPENLGIGAGLAAGLRYAALERSHDWVWTFDQDSVPDDIALGELLDGVASLQDAEGDVGIAAALPVHKETGICYPPLFWRDGFVAPSAELLQKPIWFADLVISSGSMVRRDVVKRIGLPRTDLFMYFVDFEYCLRARSHGYKIVVVTRSQFAHEMGRAREVRLLGTSRLWPDRAPWGEYYMSRNMTYVAWWLYPNIRTKRFVVRHLFRHAGGVLLFGSDKWVCLRRMVEGFWDGRRATLGIRFYPS